MVIKYHWIQVAGILTPFSTFYATENQALWLRTKNFDGMVQWLLEFENTSFKSSKISSNYMILLRIFVYYAMCNNVHILVDENI